MQELTDATWAGTLERKQYLIQAQTFESVFLQVLSGSAELKHLMKAQREFNTLPRCGCIDSSLRRNSISFQLSGVPTAAIPMGTLIAPGKRSLSLTSLHTVTSYEKWLVPLTRLAHRVAYERDHPCYRITDDIWSYVYLGENIERDIVGVSHGQWYLSKGFGGSHAPYCMSRKDPSVLERYSRTTMSLLYVNLLSRVTVLTTSSL